MQDGPPTHLLVDKISKDQCNCILVEKNKAILILFYDREIHALFVIHSANVYDDSKGFRVRTKKEMIDLLFKLYLFRTFEDPEIVDLRNFLLDKLEYEFGLDPTLHIPGHGIHVEKNEIGCDEQVRELQFYSVYRSFEDGSMHVQYIVLDSAPASSEIALDTRPRYQLKNSRSLKELYLHAKLAKLPTSRAVMPTREIMRLNVQPIRDYLNSIHEGWETISDEKKQEIGQRMRDLETPMLA